MAPIEQKVLLSCDRGHKYYSVQFFLLFFTWSDSLARAPMTILAHPRLSSFFVDETIIGRLGGELYCGARAKLRNHLIKKPWVAPTFWENDLIFP